jgi:Tfp pilus assembly protein PilO
LFFVPEKEYPMMNNLERRRFEMLGRVKDFTAPRAAQFPTESIAGQLVATINATVAELSQFASEKASRKTDFRKKQNQKADARETLRESVNTISRTARAMSNRIPAVADKFQVPRNLNDVSLLATARAFANDAVPFLADFQSYELPADFLTELHLDIADFAAAVSERNTAAESASTTLTFIEESIARGVAAVLELDVILKNRYRDDTASLNAWLRASHVERPSRTAAVAPASQPTALAGSL